jgi:hypothetical protein
MSRRVSKALLRSKLGRELLERHPGPDEEHEETSAEASSSAARSTGPR